LQAVSQREEGANALSSFLLRLRRLHSWRTSFLSGAGGFLGMGEKDVAISFENLKFAKDNDNDLVVTTNMTKETLQATPAYAKPKQ
jgi:hypothetical protein